MNEERRQYFAQLLGQGRNAEVLSELAEPQWRDEASSSIAFFRGVALQNQGHLSEAAAEYQRAAAQALGELLPTWSNWAGVEYHRGEFKEAAALAEQLSSYQPFDLDLLSLHMLSLKEAGDLAGAEAVVRRFADNLPRNPIVARWFIHILYHNKKYLEALIRAADIPVSEWGQMGLGYELLNCLMEVDLLDVAEELFPSIYGAGATPLQSEETWATKGLLHLLKREPAQAKTLLEAGMGKGYAHPGSVVNLSFALLTLGDFADGWRHHLMRSDARVLPVTGLCQGVPLWQGEPVAGKTLLVISEQGIGDVIQFLRFVPEMERLGGRVVFAAYGDVVGLLANDPQAKKVEMQPLTASDIHYQTRLLDLPYRLGIKKPEDVPRRIPYLFANAAKAAEWKEFFASVPGIKVGLVWAGNPAHAGDHYRSGFINMFAPLVGLPGVSFWGLQKGAGNKEAKCPPEGLEYQWIGDRFANFDDTAAAVVNLDLIITVDTSVAHLAAALGKPVWMLASRRNPEWRWVDHGSGNAWYPNLTVFKQEQADQWTVLIRDRIRPALAQLILSETDATLAEWQQKALLIDSGMHSWNDAEWAEWARQVHAVGAVEQAAQWLSARLSEQDAKTAIDALVTRVDDFQSVVDHRVLAQARVRQLMKQGESEEAIRLLEQVRQHHGDEGIGRAVFIDWGRYHYSKGRWSQAIDIWKLAVNVHPQDGQLHYLLGIALRDNGQNEAALTSLRRALECSPRHYLAHFGLAGLLLDDQPEEAWAAAQRAAMLNTGDPGVWQFIVHLLHAKGMYFLAEPILRTKGKVEGNFVSQVLRVHQLAMLGREQEAVELADSIPVDLDRPVKELLDYAGALGDIGRREAAVDLLTAVAERHPEHRDLRFKLGYDQLRLGRMELGWENYWRGMKRRWERRFPEWLGEPLEGKSLLVVQDQGQGDCIQFFPLLQEVWAMAPKQLTLAVCPALVTLFRAQGVPFNVVDSEKMDWVDYRYDYQVDLMALPYLLKVDLLLPRHQQPTLSVLPNLVPRWQEQIAQDKNLRVGIVWSGGQFYKTDFHRSTALADWRTLWDIAGISFYSLQKDIASNQAAVFDLPLHNLAADCRTWLETVSVMECLDLIIAVDTAVAHVGGSINKPTWLVLPNEYVDFRWQEDREDCPWYPSVRLIRRQKGEGWSQVFQRIAQDLVQRFPSLSWRNSEFSAATKGTAS